jgi:hypothetical protein
VTSNAPHVMLQQGGEIALMCKFHKGVQREHFRRLLESKVGSSADAVYFDTSIRHEPRQEAAATSPELPESVPVRSWWHCSS